MILRDGDIELISAAGHGYLSSLMRRDRYNLLNDRGIARYVKFVRYIWIGRTRGRVGGVVYFCFIPGIGWTFDAYSERDRLKELDNRGHFGYRAGVLILDWFAKKGISNEIFAVIDLENRGAKFMAWKLGFSEHRMQNGMIIMRKGV